MAKLTTFGTVEFTATQIKALDARGVTEEEVETADTWGVSYIDDAGVVDATSVSSGRRQVTRAITRAEREGMTPADICKLNLAKRLGKVRNDLESLANARNWAGFSAARYDYTLREIDKAVANFRTVLGGGTVLSVCDIPD